MLSYRVYILIIENDILTSFIVATSVVEVGRLASDHVVVVIVFDVVSWYSDFIAVVVAAVAADHVSDAAVVCFQVFCVIIFQTWQLEINR